MIRLTCTQCKSVLEMDDAFAGGVCRCQHCGTIQTVPSHLKGSAVAAGTGAKSLYQGAGAAKAGAGTRADGSNLYDLADAVTSSGLSNPGLKNKPASVFERAEPKKAPPPPNRTPLLIGAVAIIAILLGVVLWLAVAKKTPEEGNPSPNPGNPSTPTPAPVNPTPAPVSPSAPTGPHFMTVNIDANKIVYVIDRSDSAKRTLDTVKAAMFNSIESLGPNREFAVVFWGRSGEKDMKQWSFPDKGLAHATPQQVEIVRDKFADVQAFGSTDVSAAMKQAYSLKPDWIFLVTAKGIDLDDSFGRGVDAARKNSNAKVFTIDLANGEGKKFLEPVANKSHGAYTFISPLDVKPD